MKIVNSEVISDLLGEHADTFCGEKAIKNKVDAKSYNEVIFICEALEIVKNTLQSKNVTKEALTKASTNNSKGYKSTTVTDVKNELKEALSISADKKGFKASKRRSRILSRIITISFN